MNNNGINQGMNVEDYENMAVNKSNTAKKVAAAAGIFAGGAAIAGGAAYAATSHGEEVSVDEDALTTDDILDGAEAGADQPQQVVEETHTVYREVPAQPAPEAPAEPEADITWDTTTNVYVDGEVQVTTVQGTVDGHDFTLADVDGDGLADVLGVDLNDNGQFEDNEIMTYTPSDNVRISGIETAHTENHYLTGGEAPLQYTPAEEGHEVAQNEPIHNDFSDEKTGETYNDDYAENNGDYNNYAGMEMEEGGEEYAYEEPADENGMNDMGGEEYLA